MLFQSANLATQSTLESVYPVGSIFASVVPTDPAVLLNFGTWAAFGVGRCLVGVDPSDPDFDAAEKTSGTKTVALTANEMPVHTHTQDPHTHIQNAHSHVQSVNSGTTGALSGYTPDASTNGSATSGYSTQAATAVNQNATATNQNAGGGAAHNNVQPSIAVFFWKRTA